MSDFATPARRLEIHFQCHHQVQPIEPLQFVRSLAVQRINALHARNHIR